jgi:hypothetical protein
MQICAKNYVRRCYKLFVLIFNKTSDVLTMNTIESLLVSDPLSTNTCIKYHNTLRCCLPQIKAVLAVYTKRG